MRNTVGGELVTMFEKECRNGKHYWLPNHRCADCGVLDLNADEAELVAKLREGEITSIQYYKAMEKLPFGETMIEEKENESIHYQT